MSNTKGGNFSRFPNDRSEKDGASISKKANELFKSMFSTEIDSKCSGCLKIGSMYPPTPHDVTCHCV